MGFAMHRTADTAPEDRSFPFMILASISTSPFTFKTDPQPEPDEKLEARIKNLERASEFPLSGLL